MRLILLVILLNFTSCNRCKNCYIDVVEGGVQVTHDLGEQCDEDLKFLEEESCFATSGPCDFYCE